MFLSDSSRSSSSSCKEEVAVTKKVAVTKEVAKPKKQDPFQFYVNLVQPTLPDETTGLSVPVAAARRIAGMCFFYLAAEREPDSEVPLNIPNVTLGYSRTANYWWYRTDFIMPDDVRYGPLVKKWPEHSSNSFSELSDNFRGKDKKKDKPLEVFLIINSDRTVALSIEAGNNGYGNYSCHHGYPCGFLYSSGNTDNSGSFALYMLLKRTVRPVGSEFSWSDWSAFEPASMDQSYLRKAFHIQFDTEKTLTSDEFTIVMPEAGVVPAPTHFSLEGIRRDGAFMPSVVDPESVDAQHLCSWVLPHFVDDEEKEKAHDKPKKQTPPKPNAKGKLLTKKHADPAKK